MVLKVEPHQSTYKIAWVTFYYAIENSHYVSILLTFSEGAAKIICSEKYMFCPNL